MVLKIGLTGGIGSGKSTVSEFLAGKGILIIDADAISRQLTQAGGAAMPAIVQAFGTNCGSYEQGLDRARMRQLIFNDPEAKSRLEAILHPMIRQHMAALETQARSPYIVYDIPLLIEQLSRYRRQLDLICVVDCDEASQIRRVVGRSALDPQTVRKIMASQAPREARLAAADYIIDNGAEITLAQLHRQLDRLHQEWLQAAGTARPGSTL